MHKEKHIQCYPNPTADNVTITFDNGDKSRKRLMILDIAGRALQSIDIQNDIQIISMHEYSNGLYFFHIREANDDETILKVIKQ
ncbi:MAG: T9SS type A sorting domain-containing protein [Bacteroidales bacterium]|nr:T9SS type A sorting domain-containing protein [Bacteroidales bacterium]